MRVDRPLWPVPAAMGVSPRICAAIFNKCLEAAVTVSLIQGALAQTQWNFKALWNVVLLKGLRYELDICLASFGMLKFHRIFRVFPECT